MDLLGSIYGAEIDWDLYFPDTDDGTSGGTDDGTGGGEGDVPYPDPVTNV